jgi:hypothetical protein
MKDNKNLANWKKWRYLKDWRWPDDPGQTITSQRSKKTGEKKKPKWIRTTWESCELEKISSVRKWLRLIDYLRFYVPLKNFSLIWRRHHYRWRAAKFRPMLGAQRLWAGRDLYRATPAVTWDLGFSGLIRRTAPFSRLLRHTRGCGGSILTRILTGGK